MTQAIGYVRRSTDKQDLSLEQQRAKLEQFAASKGWELVHVYTDDAISGSDMERPGLRVGDVLCRNIDHRVSTSDKWLPEEIYPLVVEDPLTGELVRFDEVNGVGILDSTYFLVSSQA